MAQVRKMALRVLSAVMQLPFPHQCSLLERQRDSGGAAPFSLSTVPDNIFSHPLPPCPAAQWECTRGKVGSSQVTKLEGSRKLRPLLYPFLHSLRTFLTSPTQWEQFLPPLCGVRECGASWGGEMVTAHGLALLFLKGFPSLSYSLPQ